MRPRVRFPGHVVASGSLVRRSPRSMAAIIEVSISGCSQVVMAASVYVDSVAGSPSSRTLLSSGAVVLVSLMEQTGQEA